jgi:hypothetical protein
MSAKPDHRDHAVIHSKEPTASVRSSDSQANSRATPNQPKNGSMPHAMSSDIDSTVTTALDLTKELVDLAGATKDAEAKLIADLQVQLAELSVRLDELIEENTQLKEQLKQAASTESTRRARLSELIKENTQIKEQLKQAENTQIELIVKDGLYYRADGDGPYCKSCYDSAQKLVRLSEMPHTFRSFGNWHCSVCESHYD